MAPRIDIPTAFAGKLFTWTFVYSVCFVAALDLIAR